MTGLLPIRDEADYDRRVSMMNALLDVAGDDEDHPLSGLLERIADRVSQYEREHHTTAALPEKLFIAFPARFRSCMMKAEKIPMASSDQRLTRAPIGILIPQKKRNRGINLIVFKYQKHLNSVSNSNERS